MTPVDLDNPPTSPPLPSNTKRWLSLKGYLVRFPEWCDSRRLDSLYSQFEKLKELNPYGFEANVNCWRQVILGAARRGLLSSYQSSGNSSSSASLSSSESTTSKAVCESTGATIGVLELEESALTAKFKSNGRVPLSLQTVLQEMMTKGDVVRGSDFMPEPNASWTGWLYHKVVRAPLMWGVRQLSLSDNPPSGHMDLPSLATAGFGGQSSTGAGVNGSKRETFVILSLVQEAASRILSLQTELKNLHASDNLMTFADFRQKFSRTALLPVRERLSNGETKAIGPVIVLTDRDLEIVLRYMQRDMKALVMGKLDMNRSGNEVQDHEMVIKFCAKDAVLLKTVHEITQADRGIIELRQACKRLENQIESLETNISQLTEKARIFVGRQQKHQAMSVLKQRKYSQDMLDKRVRSLDTLSSILFKIQQAETDAEIMLAYKLGSATFGSVMATKDKDGKQILTRDYAEATMEEITDTIADQQEIDDVLNDGAEAIQRTISGSDDDELSAELDDLLNQSVTDPSSPVLANGQGTPATNNSPVIARQPVPARPIPIKRSSSPQQDKTSLPTSPSSGSGKRVAVLPEQAETVAKERKVSQTSVHSTRRNSADGGADTPARSPPLEETGASSMMQIDQPSTSNSNPTTSKQIIPSRPNPIMPSIPSLQDNMSLSTTQSESNTSVAEPSKQQQSSKGSAIVEHESRATTNPSVAPTMMQIDHPVASNSTEDEDEREIQEMLKELDEISVPQTNLPQDIEQDSQPDTTKKRTAIMTT
ncbi:MAG: Snf7-domain-containing protein [Benniella sp.]|nr:MAG: Snf7-domain-containing protein [Benniella sp.]